MKKASHHSAPPLIQRLPSFVVGIDDACVYCGEPYTCIDHMIPISMFRHDRKGSKTDAGPLAQSCEECNRLLSDSFFPAFQERLRYCQWKYSRKARRYQKMPSWSADEIAGLDHTLRSYVAHHQFEIARLDRIATKVAVIAKTMTDSTSVKPAARPDGLVCVMDVIAR